MVEKPWSLNGGQQERWCGIGKVDGRVSHQLRPLHVLSVKEGSSILFSLGKCNVEWLVTNKATCERQIKKININVIFSN